MSSTFDNLIQPIPVNKKPHLHPGSGKKEDILNTVLYKEVNGDNSKPYFNVKFRGLIVYTSIVPFEEFRKQYDSTFVEYLKGTSEASTGKSVQTGNTHVIEARVYIPELCACLPQPSSSRFFETIKKLREKPKPGEENKKIKEVELSSASFTNLQLKQIDRYPKVYALKKEVGTLRMQDMVEVIFPYNFDYSYGVIIGNAPV